MLNVKILHSVLATHLSTIIEMLDIPQLDNDLPTEMTTSINVELTQINKDFTPKNSPNNELAQQNTPNKEVTVNLTPEIKPRR